MGAVWPWLGQAYCKVSQSMTLIPPQYKLAAYGIALAVLVAGVSAWHLHGINLAREEGRKEVQAKWDKERANQRASVAEKNADSTQKTSVLVQSKAEVVNEIVVSQSKNADRGNASVERLRKLANSKPAACAPVPQSAGASQADHATSVAARLSDDDRRSLIEIGVRANDVRDQLYGCRKLLHDAWAMTN